MSLSPWTATFLVLAVIAYLAALIALLGWFTTITAVSLAVVVFMTVCMITDHEPGAAGAYLHDLLSRFLERAFGR